ncbi:hypothetical protein IFR05_001393 [Cadophora sp. M221]|nr:hypothetical protein IFR05_001393 [Cadophora sp. M221]
MASRYSAKSPGHMDFFPFRGQYGGRSIGTVFFILVCLLVPVISYSPLAPPTSTFSAFKHFPWILVSTPALTGTFDIPFVPSILLNFLNRTLGLQLYQAIIFLDATLPTLSFITYTAL